MIDFTVLWWVSLRSSSLSLKSSSRSDSITFPDFLTLSANFGSAVGSYPEGDVDLNGTVEFPDFLTMSANFGQTPGAVAAAVPEPGSLALITLGGLVCLVRRRRSE